jgi:hypothetical protein
MHHTFPGRCPARFGKAPAIQFLITEAKAIATVAEINRESSAEIP